MQTQYGLEGKVCFLQLFVGMNDFYIIFDKVVLQRRAGREHLHVLRFSRQHLTT